MTDAKATTLYLVRHGATDANLRRPYVLQGRSIDLPLNETGRRQAQCVRRLFERSAVAAVYSSPMRRARETASAIAEPHRLDVATSEGLIEVDIGRWEGMDWGRIEGQYPREYADFQRDPSQFPYLGGESYGDVSRRAFPAIVDLLERHAGQSVVVVAHNVVNRVCTAMLLGLPLSRAKEVQQSNCGVNVIRRNNGRTDLVTLNSVFHIEDELRSS